MSRILLFLAIFCIFRGTVAQTIMKVTQDFLNYQNSSGISYNNQESAQQIIGGKHITSIGLIKCLVVFIEFKNEAHDNPYWHPQQPPEFMYRFVDPDTVTKSTNYINLTYFFDQMSFGKFKLIGDPYHTVLPYTEFYAKIWEYSRRQIIMDALLQLDKDVNFQDYDNWGSYGNYNHFNSPNGIVDLIFIVFRSIDQLGWGYNGEASLGYGDGYEIDGVIINPKRLAYNASGVTCLYKCKSPEFLATIARHEFGHFLLGENHPFSDRADDRHKIWSLLDAGRMTNAYERERLGWITVPELHSGQTIRLRDFITTGDAVKYHPENGAVHEYYYFENHQKIHAFDDESLNTQDRGVYVLHMEDQYLDANNIRCKTANGCYRWENPFSVPYPPKPEIQLPAFRIVAADCAGENHRDALKTSDGDREYMRVLTNPDSEYELGEFFRGLQFEETFSADKYNVFSPWSNPNTNTWVGDQTDFAMEIIGENNDAITLSFYLGDPENVCPSIPINFRSTPVYSDSTGYPQCMWTANNEPDLSAYLIERRLGKGDWKEIARVAAICAGFTDSSLVIGSTANESCAYYRLSAVDTQGLYSNVTATWSVFYQYEKNALFAWDKSTELTDPLPDNPELGQNYPNPFNSETRFRLVLPHTEQILLSVYDISGKRVRTIYSGVMSRGEHILSWDGRNVRGKEVTSGVYVYRLTTASQVQNKKMVLVR